MEQRKPQVLVVDDESDDTRTLVAFLRERDLEVTWCRDGAGALRALAAAAADCLVLALDAPRIDGPAVLRRARERNPDVCAVVLTEETGIERAVDALGRGACDFQVRPVHREKVLAVLRRGLAQQALAARAAELECRLDERYGFEGLIGRSRAITRVVAQLRAIAPTRATVLVEGEAGTGKRLVGQAIHQNSPRKRARFSDPPIDAMPEAVAAPALFGLEERDPAGAPVVHRGYLERAEGGTIYLHDIGGASPSLQVRLLRALQDRTFERVGGGEALRTDVRVLAGTTRDLAAEVKAGRFREDLYQRLGAVRVHLPPLRERAEDIPLLIEAFIHEANRAYGRRVSGVTRGALEQLMRHPWPGNVGELRNTIEAMVIAARGRRRLELSDVPGRLREAGAEGARLDLAVGMTVEEAERRLIAATLQHAGRDKPRAAAMLGIGLRTLYRKIKAYGIR